MSVAWSFDGVTYSSTDSYQLDLQDVEPAASPASTGAEYTVTFTSTVRPADDDMEVGGCREPRRPILPRLDTGAALELPS